MATGRKFRMLDVVDEFPRECPAIRVDRKLNSTAAIDVLTDLFILRGVPGPVRSDNDEGKARRSSSPRRCGTGSRPWGRDRRRSMWLLRFEGCGNNRCLSTVWPNPVVMFR
jgi:hypothetical protein